MSDNHYTIDLGGGRTVTLSALSFREKMRSGLDAPAPAPPVPPEGYTIKEAMRLKDFKAEYEAWQNQKAWNGMLLKVGLAASKAQDDKTLSPDIRNAEFIAWGDLSKDPHSAGIGIYLAAQGFLGDDKAAEVIADACIWIEKQSVAVTQEGVQAEAELFQGDGKQPSA